MKCTKCAILKIAKFRENKWNLGPLQRPLQVYSGRVNHSQSTVNISALKSPALLLTDAFRVFSWKLAVPEHRALLNNSFWHIGLCLQLELEVCGEKVDVVLKLVTGLPGRDPRKAKIQTLKGRWAKCQVCFFKIYFMDRPSTHTLYFNQLNCITCRV